MFSPPWLHSLLGVSARGRAKTRRNPHPGTSISRFDSQDVSEGLFEARGAQRVAEEVHARIQGHEEELQIPEPVECIAAAAFAETQRVD